MRRATERTESLREHNRRETFQRIADRGIELFLQKGYDATTVDDLAAAAGVSRRTFFYYFKSKDEIFGAQMNIYADVIRRAIVEGAPKLPPFDAVAAALVKLSAHFESPRTVAIARLMRSSDASSLRKLPGHLQMEQPVFDALCELWPEVQRRDSLRLVAMASAGTLRFAVDKWLESDGLQPLSRYIEDAFARLKSEI
ncbi:MAG: helix-turn-helix domain containing protein [Ancalomicrobiaceae bacterium]|nr:helix-turn-helix domain containing protein [Ancalomicrobiaceae bacterium]